MGGSSESAGRVEGLRAEVLGGLSNGRSSLRVVSLSGEVRGGRRGLRGDIGGSVDGRRGGSFGLFEESSWMRRSEGMGYMWGNGWKSCQPWPSATLIRRPIHSHMMYRRVRVQGVDAKVRVVKRCDRGDGPDCCVPVTPPERGDTTRDKGEGRMTSHAYLLIARSSQPVRL
jgi:hypothetical protein